MLSLPLSSGAPVSVLLSAFRRFMRKEVKRMAVNKDLASEYARELAKVLLAGPAGERIYPNKESAKNIAEFIRTITEELSEM